jgi:SAM-dependent methyltransferase
MSFYADFAEYYEAVFPYREPVYAFLAEHLTGPAQRILDVGCGTGHYCGRLAAAGHRVVGIDLDPEMVAVAEREYPGVDFRCLDMVDVAALAGESPGAAFNLIYCLGNVAAHLPRERCREFLHQLARLLAPGGRWIFQVVNWDHILTHDAYRFPDKKIGEEGVVFQREYREITSAGLRFRTRLCSPEWTIFTGEVRLYPVRVAEYLTLHAATGFVLEGHYADYRRTPFVPHANSGSIYVFRCD